MGKFAKIRMESDRYVLPTYRRLPVAFVKGSGAVLTAVDGKKYLDFLSGLAVTGLGHANHEITRVIVVQARKLLHVSNLYVIPEQVALAKKLVTLSGLHQAFFCNSGTEANEAAIKFVRHASIKQSGDSERVDILCAQDSFHGRTFGSLSATMQDVYQSGFGALVPGFKKVPFNDFEALAAAVTDKTCAVLLEPIQAEGGMVFPDADYLKKVAGLCSARGLYLMLDEVQTGMGRTGRFFAFENYGVKPDVVTMAKALGSGVPIGATLVSEKIAKHIRPGSHASTFGGNPLASSVALKTVKTISTESFLTRVRKNGKLLLKLCRDLQTISPGRIKSVQGIGLFVAVEFVAPSDGAAVVKACLEKGLIINVIKDKVIRLAPPLIVSVAELKTGMSILKEVLIHLNVVLSAAKRSRRTTLANEIPRLRSG